MAYSNRTQFFGIPYMGVGDLLTEEQEQVQMSIIDSLLYAFSYGCKALYIEEGSYSMSMNGTERHLIISPTVVNGYSLLGIIGGRMFASKETLSVEYTMYEGNTYYAYIEYNQALNTDASAFEIAIYSEEQELSDERMPLCVIDTQSNTIDDDVDKIHARSIISHTADSTNPHGATLSQSNIVVSNEATRKNAQMPGALYGSYVTNGSSAVVQQVETSGQIAFVTAFAEDASAGSIAWSINGNEISFTNSGAAGIAVNYKVDIL